MVKKRDDKIRFLQKKIFKTRSLVFLVYIGLQLVFITFYVLCVLQSWLSIGTAIKSMKETRIYMINRTISFFNKFTKADGLFIKYLNIYNQPSL